MVLNQEQFDAFRMEIATFGNIPILSQYCGIGCVFCKVHTDSYLGHYPKIPPIDREDLLKGFEYINPNVNYVRLGAGVLVAPHTDPFLHPKIYDFIKIASEPSPCPYKIVSRASPLLSPSGKVASIREPIEDY